MCSPLRHFSVGSHLLPRVMGLSSRGRHSLCAGTVVAAACRGETGTCVNMTEKPDDEVFQCLTSDDFGVLGDILGDDFGDFDADFISVDFVV